MIRSPAFRRLVLVPALALYASLLGEASVRVLDPQPLMPRYVTGMPWGVRGNMPNSVFRHVTPEVDVGYRINSEGMRADREYPKEPPRDACRVAIIGDSYFLGYEVDAEDTVARHVEAALNDSGLPTEVLNFSVSGMGTAEMLLTYEGQIRRFSPDLLIVQWHYTDLEDNVRSGLFAVRDGQLQQVAREYLPSVAVQEVLGRSAVYRFLSEHSHLYSFVRERASGLGKDAVTWMRKATATTTQASADGAAASAAATPGVPAQAPASIEELSARLLRRMQEQTSADGTGLLVVDLPDMLGREKLVSVWDTLPAGVVGGLPVLHGAEVFAPLASPSTKLYFERGHRHLTPLASAALGKSIASRIRAELAAGRCGARRE